MLSVEIGLEIVWKPDFFSSKYIGSDPLQNMLIVYNHYQYFWLYVTSSSKMCIMGEHIP